MHDLLAATPADWSVDEDFPADLAPINRPRTRSECMNGERPCPWVGCRYHLMSEVTPAGRLTLHLGRHGHGRSWRVSIEDIVGALEVMPETCALDMADKRNATLCEIGNILHMSRERIRQIQVAALEKVKDCHPAITGLPQPDPLPAPVTPPMPSMHEVFAAIWNFDLGPHSQPILATLAP